MNIESLYKIAISTNPIEISLNEDNKPVVWFRECDKEEIDNLKKIDLNNLFIPSVLVNDFEYICFNHLPLYEHDNGIWYKMTENCDCKTRKYIWCKDDFHFRIGKDISERASKAIFSLEKLGYYYRDHYNGTPIVSSFDDFMKYSAKRIYLLGDLLCRLVNLGNLLPHHLFGFFDYSKHPTNTTYEINYMVYGDKPSKTYFINKKKKFYCRNCNVSGHTTGYCYRMNLRCYKCKKWGHIYRNCTLK